MLKFFKDSIRISNISNFLVVMVQYSKISFQFAIADDEYEEVMKRIIAEDTDIEEIGDAKPQCSHCQKIFSRNSTLKRHMLIHDPNYSRQDTCQICEICGKLIRGIMSTHYRVHSDNKPFQCELCEKNFRLIKLIIFCLICLSGIIKLQF